VVDDVDAGGLAAPAGRPPHASPAAPDEVVFVRRTTLESSQAIENGLRYSVSVSVS
jgi:hypothetical protein